LSLGRDNIPSRQDIKTELLNEFHDYDDAVTCVACWYYLLTQTSDYSQVTRHFEWFPSIDVGDRRKTPDFTALLQSGGIVAEIKAGIPQDESALTEKLEQLASYDRLGHLPRNAKGTLEQVSYIDLVVLLHRRNAHDARRVLSALSEPGREFRLSKPPIFMTYAFETDRGQTKMAIDRLDIPGNGSFTPIRHESCAQDLYRHFCEEGRRLAWAPKQFYQAKTQFMRVMNDPPKRLYSAYVLWEELLGEAVAKGVWEAVSPRQKVIELVVHPHEISQRLTDKILANHIFTIDCVRDALEFLRKAELASRLPEPQGAYRVRLQSLLPRKSARITPSETKDVAEQLAERYATHVFRPTSPTADASVSDTAQLPLRLVDS